MNQPNSEGSAKKDVLIDLPVEGAKRALVRKLLEVRTIQGKERYPPSMRV